MGIRSAVHRGLHQRRTQDMTYVPLAMSNVSAARYKQSPPPALDSSSRSQRVMWSTTALTPSDLPRTVRGRPLASVGVCGGCYSVSYSPAKGRSDGGHGPTRATDWIGDA
jgi:hypothetical protein